MRTTHAVLIGDSRQMTGVQDASVHLVVTSPPYPMIEMWDESFASLDPTIARALADDDGDAAFERMHALLDATWAEVARVLVPGGIACVNVGDATRSIGGRFQLFPNHARILAAFHALGFDVLPGIVWRKTTNAPNKFMGSGMLPPAAYVTLEHEHILVLRKGGKRAFESHDEKAARSASAYFWEERNRWFSDVWDLKGVRQSSAGTSRDRSGAFPFEIPWRLIHMFSLQGDTVLDPFGGTGTTAVAAIAAARSSLSIEIAPSFAATAHERIAECLPEGRDAVAERLAAHERFVAERAAAGKPPAHHNARLRTPVVTRQETDLALWEPHEIARAGDPWSVEHRRVSLQDRLADETAARPA